MQMPKFKPTRLLITSFYIATVVSFYIFQLIVPMLNTWTGWLISVIGNFTGQELVSEGSVWWALLVVCMSITFMIRRFIIEPLGFYVNGNATSMLELATLATLVLGFYLYSFNTLFPDYVMPDAPIFFQIMVGEIENSQQSLLQSNTWSIVPWLWYAGPIGFMYGMFVRSEFSYAKMSREKSD
jgi:hypothetical protein